MKEYRLYRVSWCLACSGSTKHTTVGGLIPGGLSNPTSSPPLQKTFLKRSGSGWGEEQQERCQGEVYKQSERYYYPMTTPLSKWGTHGTTVETLPQSICSRIIARRLPRPLQLLWLCHHVIRCHLANWCSYSLDSAEITYPVMRATSGIYIQNMLISLPQVLSCATTANQDVVLSQDVQDQSSIRRGFEGTDIAC
jgi:hypothetical protein